MDNPRIEEPVGDAGGLLRTDAAGGASLGPRESVHGRSSSVPEAMSNAPPAIAGKLPVCVISNILRLADPNTFSSLALVNTAWRAAGQSTELYKDQLAQCAPQTPRQLKETELSILRRRFYSETKRNLFESYLRPRECVIELRSTTTGSSVAFPGGDALRFSFAHNGQRLLAFNSSRIYIFNLASEVPSVDRELRCQRRPASVAIDDTGSTLAVMSTDFQVNVYDLKSRPVTLRRTLSLDNTPRTIALSPSGAVLAAAYMGGIEVYSLAPRALSTDRRAVRCDAIDSLSFSSDGTLLLGTTLKSSPPSTVVLSAPYYDDILCDGVGVDAHVQMWTTQILFPNSQRNKSHASLLPSQEDGDASWTFIHDWTQGINRAVRVDDLDTGATSFKLAKSDGREAKTMPTTLPSADSAGELVAAGFHEKEIWLFGVPEELDQASETTRSPSDSPNSRETISDTENYSPESNGVPTPESNLRTVFRSGHHLGDLDRLSALKWVSAESKGGPDACRNRLVAVAPGTAPDDLESSDGKVSSSDSGRVMLFDFQNSSQEGEKIQIEVEVGTEEAELLAEEGQDLEIEVANVRRRSLVPRPLSLALPRRPSPEPPPNGYIPGPQATSADRKEVAGLRVPAANAFASRPITNRDTLPEEPDVFDDPYSHGQPRSRTTLQRAATASAARRERGGFNLPRIFESGRTQFRRPRAAGELPDESDADNWVPPPPPYKANPDEPLPSHLEQGLQSRARGNTIERNTSNLTPARSQTFAEGMDRSPRRRGTGSRNSEASTEDDRSFVLRRERTEPSSRTDSDRNISPEIAQAVAAISVGPDTVAGPETMSTASSSRSRSEHNTPRRRPMSCNFARVPSAAFAPLPAQLVPELGAEAANGAIPSPDPTEPVETQNIPVIAEPQAAPEELQGTLQSERTDPPSPVSDVIPSPLPSPARPRPVSMAFGLHTASAPNLFPSPLTDRFPKGSEPPNSQSQSSDTHHVPFTEAPPRFAHRPIIIPYSVQPNGQPMSLPRPVSAYAETTGFLNNQSPGLRRLGTVLSTNSRHNKPSPATRAHKQSSAELEPAAVPYKHAKSKRRKTIKRNPLRKGRKGRSADGDSQPGEGVAFDQRRPKERRCTIM